MSEEVALVVSCNIEPLLSAPISEVLVLALSVIKFYPLDEVKSCAGELVRSVVLIVESCCVWSVTRGEIVFRAMWRLCKHVPVECGFHSHSLFF